MIFLERGGCLALLTIELADRADRRDLGADQLLRHGLRGDIDERVEAPLDLGFAECVSCLLRRVDRTRVRLVDFGEGLGQERQRLVPTRGPTRGFVVGHVRRFGLLWCERTGERDDDLQQAHGLALLGPGLTQRRNRARIAELFELGHRTFRFSRIVQLLGPSTGFVLVVRTAGLAGGHHRQQNKGESPH